MPHPLPENEADRLGALGRYQVLDTAPEFAHDALTELAAQLCRCPVALISLIDERRPRPRSARMTCSTCRT